MRQTSRKTVLRDAVPELLSTKETAKLFGISANFLHTHPEIPRYKIGKHSRYNPAELTAFFKEQAELRNR